MLVAAVPRSPVSETRLTVGAMIRAPPVWIMEPVPPGVMVIAEVIFSTVDPLKVIVPFEAAVVLILKLPVFMVPTPMFPTEVM